MAESLFTRFTIERCPECHNASLAILPGSFSEGPSAGTVRHRDELWFDAEHYEFIFTCRLICERSTCRETVAISGNGGLEDVYGYDEQGKEEHSCIEWFQAKTFFPPLPLFIPPAGCPDSVLDQLKDISSLLTGHPAAAANAIRSLVEVLLDDFGIPRVEERPGKSPRNLWLGERLKLHKDKLGEHHDGMDALKLFGNAGSHGGSPIKNKHLDDACLVVEYLLTQLYSRRPDVSIQIARLSESFKRKPDSQ